MAYLYDVEQMRMRLREILADTAGAAALQWLEERRERFAFRQETTFFNLTFTVIPRHIPKTPLGDEAAAHARGIREGLSISGWTADQLARCWWLLQLPLTDADTYFHRLDSLFSAAEMNEQVALYAALPLMAFPERFRRRASEGVRTALGSVFDAVALDNPYPSEQMEEAPWNQLVLKAFFMDRPVNRIYGLDKRSNAGLARILSDYAHERWAASRPVNPLLWKPVSPFVDDHIFPDILRLSTSGQLAERQAAALVSASSPFPDARKLLDTQPDLRDLLQDGKLSWDMLAPGERT